MTPTLALTVLAVTTSSMSAVDTTFVLGAREIDVTGDGVPETLRLVAAGESIDSLAVNFSIETEDDTLFSMPFGPLTPTIGYDAGRRTLDPEAYVDYLAQFGDRFFGTVGIMSPPEFMAELQRSGPFFIAEIPAIIARDRRRPTVVDSLIAAGMDEREAFRASERLLPQTDLAEAADLWNDIQQNGSPAVRFSPGGDLVLAMAWHERDRRFYRILECC